MGLERRQEETALHLLQQVMSHCSEMLGQTSLLMSQVQGIGTHA